MFTMSERYNPEVAAPVCQILEQTMCLGGGGSDQYSAYDSGHFGRWKEFFDKKAAIDTRLAEGEMTQAQADAELAAGGFTGPNDDFSWREEKIRKDPSANMEMREIKRQHDVGLGRIGIDKSFSQFDDGYYADYQKKHGDFYNPQLDRQYGEVVDKTTASLADRGMLESSVGARKFGDLTRENADARANIASEGLDAANKLKGQVANSKSSLYSLNEASANPQAINAQAVGQATSLVAPPVYSPLGQVFANALNSISNFQSARSNRPGPAYSSPYGSPTGFGSGKVIP